MKSERFLARPGNRIEQTAKANKGDLGCKPKELSKFRNEENDATVVSFDMFCTGKDTGELVTPDDKSQAIFLAWIGMVTEMLMPLFLI